MYARSVLGGFTSGCVGFGKCELNVLHINIPQKLTQTVYVKTCTHQCSVLLRLSKSVQKPRFFRNTASRSLVWSDTVDRQRVCSEMLGHWFDTIGRQRRFGHWSLVRHSRSSVMGTKPFGIWLDTGNRQ